jgi:CubicO group peptidase (beta-lactamase class C family)
VGLDERALVEADRRIQADRVGVYSLLVVRHGRLAWERYYGGYTPDDAFAIQSVTKSVVAALVGIAVGDGRLQLDQTIGELLHQRLAAVADPRTRVITVAQLLTMTAGFDWHDPGDYYRVTGEDDWVRAILATPLAHKPGATFTYNFGCSQLLSAIVAAVTGHSAAAFATARLFVPLGIEPAGWPTDPQGNPIGATGLELTARDMAKLGLLYLNEGRWADVQLAPATYIAVSTTPQSPGGDPEDAAYGYHWWVTSVAGDAAFFAAGYGGQYIYVVPARELVVVTTARWDLPPAETLELRPLIEAVVVPAARDEGSVGFGGVGPAHVGDSTATHNGA